MRRLLTAVALAVLLLPGCSSTRDDPGPGVQAASACQEVGPLLSRASLRRSDVSALGRARASAERAARADSRWSALQQAATTARDTALAVEASSRRPTSNTDQSRIDAAYRTARTALAEACAGLD